MRRVDLSARAQDDIISIAAYGIEAFGSTQIHRFGYGSHIILYTITDDGIAVGRIPHGRMDVMHVLDEPG